MEWEQLKSDVESIVGKRLDCLQSGLEVQRSRLIETISKIQSFGDILKTRIPNGNLKKLEEDKELQRPQTARLLPNRTESMPKPVIDLKKNKKFEEDKKNYDDDKNKKEEVKTKAEEAKKKKAEDLKKKKEEEDNKKKEALIKKKEDEEKKKEEAKKKKEDDDKKREEAKKKLEEAKEKKKQEDLDKKAKLEENKKKAEEDKKKHETDKKDPKKKIEEEKLKKTEESDKKKSESKNKTEDETKKEEKKKPELKKPEDFKKKLEDKKKLEESKKKLSEDTKKSEDIPKPETETKLEGSKVPEIRKSEESNTSEVTKSEEPKLIEIKKSEESKLIEIKKSEESSPVEVKFSAAEEEKKKQPELKILSSDYNSTSTPSANTPKHQESTPRPQEEFRRSYTQPGISEVRRQSTKPGEFSQPSLEEVQNQLKYLTTTCTEEELLLEKTFELSVGAKSALSLLTTMDDEKFYLDRFPRPEVTWTFRLFFTLLGQDLPENDEEAWTISKEFLIDARNKEKNKKTIDKVIIEKIGTFNFSNENIDKLEELIHGKDNLLQPQYYTDFCALTGLLMFGIREAALFGGATKGKIPIWRQYKRLLHKQAQLTSKLSN
jgi:hypothetical protein